MLPTAAGVVSLVVAAQSSPANLDNLPLFNWTSHDLVLSTSPGPFGSRRSSATITSLDPSKVRRRFIISACFDCASDAQHLLVLNWRWNGKSICLSTVVAAQRTGGPSAVLFVRNRAMLHRCFERCLQEPVLRIGAGYANLPQQPYNYY